MAYLNDNYMPNAKSRQILAAAWEHIQSVPYKVTARWLFYRLLQDGFYKGKDDVGTFSALFSRARHNNFEGWRPDTLADDTRNAIVKTGGLATAEDWVEYMAEGGFTCQLDHFYRQENYIELWFEAEAMRRQFEYYTRGITLRPMKGQASIDYKYSIAKDIEKQEARYDKPVVILYFGDLDDAGIKILEVIERDVRGWCDVDFEVDRCGLNPGDAEKYNIPENPDHPGAYQWEAVTDETARELITKSIAKYLDMGEFDAAQSEGKKAAAVFNDFVRGFSDFYHGEG